MVVLGLLTGCPTPERLRPKTTPLGSGLSLPPTERAVSSTREAPPSPIQPPVQPASEPEPLIPAAALPEALPPSVIATREETAGIVEPPPVMEPAPLPARETNSIPVGIQPDAKPPAPALMNWAGWAQRQQLPLPRFTQQNGQSCFEILTPADRLVLFLGSRYLQWNGINIGLGFVPELHREGIYVHSIDLEKSFKPLLQSRNLLFKNRVILLDPGHGGENAGTRSRTGTGFEKQFTIDWAYRAGRLLAADGWEVYLTRTNDVDVSLGNRVAMADKLDAALFISLHFNSVQGPRSDSESGLETYCLTPVGLPSNLTRDYPDDPTHVFRNNAFDIENFELARRLHRELLGQAGLKDRGLRRARFMSVLREQNRPSVLIEGGYLSHPLEARQIADPNYRQRLAQGVRNALLQ